MAMLIYQRVYKTRVPPVATETHRQSSTSSPASKVPLFFEWRNTSPWYPWRNKPKPGSWKRQSQMSRHPSIYTTGNPEMCFEWNPSNLKAKWIWNMNFHIYIYSIQYVLEMTTGLFHQWQCCNSIFSDQPGGWAPRRKWNQILSRGCNF